MILAGKKQISPISEDDSRRKRLIAVNNGKNKL
jgi:hypothetical protein